MEPEEPGRIPTAAHPHPGEREDDQLHRVVHGRGEEVSPHRLPVPAPGHDVGMHNGLPVLVPDVPLQGEELHRHPHPLLHVLLPIPVSEHEIAEHPDPGDEAGRLEAKADHDVGDLLPVL